MCAIFFGFDQQAEKHKPLNGYFRLRHRQEVVNTDEERTITVLNLVHCRCVAQGTLCGNKELDEYTVKYILTMLDRWSHTTVLLQTDEEPATTAMANLLRVPRPMSTPRERLANVFLTERRAL